MKQLLILAFFMTNITGYAQINYSLTPEPASIHLNEGFFELDEQTVIFHNEETLRAAAFLSRYLQDYYQMDIRVKSFSGKIRLPRNNEKTIVLAYKSNAKNRSAYTLNVSKNNVLIYGSAEGVFHGIQTLIQLLPAGKTVHSNVADGQMPKQDTYLVPQVSVTDSARFTYRGMHLDAGRHFFSVEYVKKYIDFLAWHKFNNFHWHLTEDQGWRIEIKKYPKLTEVGSCRDQTLSGRYGSDTYDGKKYCGFYTQQQIREIVQYAADRYINIIPEIDMPGHTKAALASYPYLGCTKGPYEVMQTWGVSEEVLCAGNDSTYRFLQDVLDEVMELFPSHYIHIGGDECPKTRWKQCNSCRKKIRDNNLKDEHELQSYFVQRIEKYVNSKGRTIIGWDEILEGGLAPNAVVMSWRGEKGGIAAARQNHFAIMTPESPLYFNHTQSRNEDSVTQGGYNPVENVYNYDPVPKELDQKQATYILGAQGNMWSEYISNERKLEYMLFPRLSAFSEVVWSPREKRNWPAFEKKFPGITERYKRWGVNYSNAYYDLQPSVSSMQEGTVGWKLESRNENAKIIYVKDSTTNAVFPYTSPVAITESGIYGAALTDEHDHIISNWAWQHFRINKATGKKITLRTAPNKSYSAGGAFTLVDGVQNDKGMLKSMQFLGFNGADMEAIIDLGHKDSIQTITLHAFEQTGSWIYSPAEVSFYLSDDGVRFTLLETLKKGKGVKNLVFETTPASLTRFIKVVAKNYGPIPTGQPGGGNNAWLFVDEIEVK